MSAMRTILTSIAAIAVVCSGVGMWKTLAPGEERKKEILKQLPESNPVRMEESRNRNALMMQVLKEAANTNDNLARDYRRQK